LWITPDGVKFGKPRIEAARGEAVAAIMAEAVRAAGNVVPIIAGRWRGPERRDAKVL